jgi:hypothetical protein
MVGFNRGYAECGCRSVGTWSGCFDRCRGLAVLVLMLLVAGCAEPAGAGGAEPRRACSRHRSGHRLYRHDARALRRRSPALHQRARPCDEVCAVYRVDPPDPSALPDRMAGRNPRPVAELCRGGPERSGETGVPRRGPGGEPYCDGAGVGAGIFVHGFNYNFPETVFRLAQLSADATLEGPQIAFSWPSQANCGATSTT